MPDSNLTKELNSNVTKDLVSNVTRELSEQGDNQDRAFLKEDITITCDKDTYIIHADKRIGMGGESLVYRATRQRDGAQVVAKIYDEFPDTRASHRNRNQIIEFLLRNNEYKETHIMPLLDIGIYSIAIEGGILLNKPVDIIPFCEEGELKKCSYAQLKEKVIPEILRGLNVLHTSNLVHRDIKPSNIYTLDDVIVIADFGTSGTITADNKFDFIGTQKKRGTLGYTAPEVWQGYASVASDYYSLGCTIATLYKSEHVYERFIKSGNDSMLNRAINSEGLPLDCPESESDLQELVNALVVVDENNRAGYEDVALWLSDTIAFFEKWRNRHRQEDSLLNFTFEGNTYDDEVELTEALLAQDEAAKRFLYRSIFTEFFKSRNPALADKIICITENRETATNQDLGLAMFLHHLNTVKNPVCPIYWCSESYNAIPEISGNIYKNTADKGKIIAMLQDKFLSWKLRNTQGMDEKLIQTADYVESVAGEYPELGYYTLMFCFDSGEIKKPDSPDALFKLLISDISTWYSRAKALLEDDRALAYFIGLGFKDNVLSLKKSLGKDFISDDSKSISNLTRLYQLFEGVCDDKEYVREHYINYGPPSYLYWFKNNITLYTFHTQAAKETERNIKNININKNMSINDMYSSFGSLRAFIYNDFMTKFQNNYLLPYIGLSVNNEITTANTHAYFVGDYFGIPVPVGYLKAIGMQKWRI